MGKTGLFAKRVKLRSIKKNVKEIFYDLKVDVPTRRRKNTSPLCYGENLSQFNSNYAQYRVIHNNPYKQFET